LLGGPDAGWFGAAVPREFRSFGRVDCEELLDVNGVSERLPEGAVNM
jgi:hypothetical protein